MHVNFFEHQDRARQSTRVLVLLFFTAIASLVLITTFLVAAVIAVSQENAEAGMNPDFMGSDIFLGVSVLVVAVVLLGTFYRQIQLRGGGRTVAESLGGKLLSPDSRNADERRILNVVEEMAIASGVPVPQVFLLEDSSINAFAAGYTPQDAVIGITRGCMELLDRDELQGVVAHEFSHIFNGDMRLNIKLIGWLYGITVIGLIGYHLMRSGAWRGMRNSRDNRGGLVMLGLGLVVVGYGGTFFGSLIKAAVSRQREFLADASAVQFTRNPAGIGNALKKIGGWSEGSMIRSVGVSEVSHMLFGQGVKAGFTGLMATHPPLSDRIRRIEPKWDGQFLQAHREELAKIKARESAKGKPGNAGGITGLGGLVTAAGVIDSIGDPSQQHLDIARDTLALLPQRIVDEAHTTLGACLLMHSLVVSCSDEAIADKQISILRKVLGENTFNQFSSIHSIVAGLNREMYLPLVEMALPALRQLSTPQYGTFMQHLQALITSDSQISLFEWCLSRMIRHNMDSVKAIGNRKLDACANDCAELLSAFACAGHTSAESAEAAFNAGLVLLKQKGSLKLEWRAHPDQKMLDRTLGVLQKIAPLQKPLLLKAIVACIEHDGEIRTEEGELLRAVGSILDCPIPPFRIPR